MSHVTVDSNDAGGYDQVLNRVRQLSTALQGALEVRPGARPRQGRACLVDLHNRTRGIAAVPNQALGTCRNIDD